MAFCPGNSDLAAELVRSFGVDPNRCKRVTIDLPANGMATATLEVYVDDDQMPLLQDVVAECEPVIVEVPKESPRASFDGLGYKVG